MDAGNIIWIYFSVVNLIGFFMMAYDKLKAKQGGWRVPEVRIFLIGLIMGASGIYAAMHVLRHKTQHRKFVIGIPLIIVLNVLCLIYLLQTI
ncbi:DUF1294 domain-containing protein [Dehalobacter sp. DCM]|uniref:DUF1294 domain-containing protein n=1 Tax=Dehalobacter sp. DCM TaxID=2907827 RepID=UPI003081B93A|nr:DUF1294 domain-containing protein [Dehalobacter sp. DCM]